MRAWILPVLFVLLIASVPSLADDQKPPMDLLVYPGAETTMEVNLSAEDILPMIQAALPLMSGGKAGLAEMLRPEDLSDLLKDVKRIEVLQLELKRAKTTVDQIVSYYSTNIPAGKWSRVFYSSSAGATWAVCAAPELKSYYGFRVRTATVDGKQIKQIDAAKIVGKIDLGRLVKLVTKLIETSSQPPHTPDQ